MRKHRPKGRAAELNRGKEAGIREDEPLDLEFLAGLEKTLSEWNSDNDEEAYRDL